MVKKSCLHEQMPMAFILFYCLSVLFFLSVIPTVSAQVPGSLYGKAPTLAINELASGNPQDLIVVFDDKAAQKTSEELQSMTGMPSRDRNIIEHKAARFTEKKQEVLSAFGSHEATVLKNYSHLPLSFIRIHSQEAFDRLLANPDVVNVYENRIERLHLAESLPLIGQPQIAALGNLGAGTTVAVLDTGVDYTRSAFGSCTAPGIPANCKVVYAQDFAPSDGKRDENGHGTNVAGIVLGVAPGTKIAALDVFSGTTANSTDILKAIDWVIANRAVYNIVAMNLSLGSGKYTSPVTSGAYNVAVNQARAAGILTIASAGNDAYTNALSQPAATAGVISVGAVYDSTMGSFNWGNPLRCSDSTSSSDKVTCFSNSASFLTLLAPGSQILAAGITQGGTSQAAPHVAGAVAVMRAAFPNETLDQTVARLISGVMVTDSRNDIVKPRLNMPMALGANASCSYSLSETSKSFSSISSSGSVAVTTSAGCTWNAASTTGNSDWITVTSGSSGSGNGTVNYSVSANANIASRTGTITVAGKTYTVTQSGSVGAVSNILLNPGFEDGPVSWTDSPTNKYPVITAYLNPTTTNSWYAWLCGYNNCVDKLYQDLTVPADAQSAYVQFNYWITTDETSNATAYDNLTLRIYSPPSATTYTYWTLSNLNSTTDWVLSPKYDLSTFKGQAIRLQFDATTDSSFATNFFVDDVTLMVSGSAPDKLPPTVPTGLTATAISASAINLAWTSSIDNVGVAAYKIYRNGILVAMLGNVTAYRDTGLSVSTSYTYTVSACDMAGNCSPQSISKTILTPGLFADTQPPTVPTGLRVTSTSTSTINLSWNASTDNVGVGNYKVYRNGTLYKVLGNVISYSDIQLKSLTSYSYTVAACDAAGNCSAQSTAILSTTLSTYYQATPIVFEGSSSFQVNGKLVNITINTIRNKSSIYTSGSLRLELWATNAPYSYSSSALGIRTASVRTILVSGLSDQLLPNASFSGITLNLTYTAPSAGYENYVLLLLQYDPTNCSEADGFCTIDYINYHELQPPTVPTGLSLTSISSSQISLTWTASTDNVGVTTYRVYRNGILVSLLGNVTSYIDGGLAASTFYTYTISACDAWGNCSAQSTAASVTTSAAPDTQAPTMPTGLRATVVSSTNINLAWSASTDNVGVTAYKIYSGGTLVATLGNVTSSSRTVSPSATYSYSVSACDAAGNCSAQSAFASATTPALPDSQPPTVPTALMATVLSSSQINLSWNASTDNIEVTAYKIYSSDGQTVTLGNVTSYINTGLRPSTAYIYTIAACDAAGNCSEKSASATATTNAACTFILSPSSGTFAASSASGVVSVVPSPSSCSWTATSNNPWITVMSGSSGTGNGTVTYSVAANSSLSRTGTITIGGQPFTITQTSANNHFDTVQKTYIGYYQRPADPGGLIYWAGRLVASNGKLTDIIDAFANSLEAQSLYGTINSSNISSVVNSIYLALFNRDADEGGRNYYVNNFKAGIFPDGRRCTPGSIVLDILYGAVSSDAQSVNNKLTAANSFTMAIDPELDGLNFQVTYAGESDNIAARNFLTLHATSVKVPTQAETTAYIKANIANPGDEILTQ